MVKDEKADARSVANFDTKLAQSLGVLGVRDIEKLPSELRNLRPQSGSVRRGSRNVQELCAVPTSTEAVGEPQSPQRYE